MRYILNSAVITSPGLYSYRLLTQEEAREWAARGQFLSTVGYEETAQALSEFLGTLVPVNRTTIRMAPGDEALVFRLVLPPGTPRIAPDEKGRLREALQRGWWECGLLVRIE